MARASRRAAPAQGGTPSAGTRRASRSRRFYVTLAIFVTGALAIWLWVAVRYGIPRAVFLVLHRNHHSGCDKCECDCRRCAQVAVND